MKHLNKQNVKKLQQLESERRELSTKRTVLSLENRELLKEYDRLSRPGSTNGKFSGLLKRKDRHVKLRDRIEELSAEVEGIEQQLEDLDKQISAVRLEVFNDYVKAAEDQDKVFRKAFDTLKSENEKLKDIFKEVSGVLKISTSAGTTVPDYSRINVLNVEIEDKRRFWNRSKRTIIGKLSEPEPEPDLMQVVYIRKKSKSAYFVGTPSSVPKETGIEDIDNGYAVPVDEFDESMIA